MKKLCMICARAGSKGVKNKNIRAIAGKPLIAHSIRQAIDSGLFDDIAVSSDSEDILSIAAEYGATQIVRRPEELAGDTAPKIPVFKHCVLEVEKRRNWQFDYIFDLDATSPLRNASDIKNVLELLMTHQDSNVITAAPARRSPYFNMVELDASGHVTLSKALPEKITRRQDAPKCYDMNASIYAWYRDVLMENETLFLSNTQLYVMPEERSLDIDTELDFKIVNYLLENGLTNP